jgi:two-component system, NtrC family, sensor kinase
VAKLLSSKTNKILIIDDEEANVRVLAKSLRSDGYEVVTAFSGEAGLAVYHEESPDLVLTDIKMPGMDGLEVLQQIKAMHPDATVVIITGHGDIDNAIEALKLGASDFINKPIRDEALALAIARAEEKRNIKRQLREYTDNLEQKVELATREIKRQSNFLAQLIRSSNDGIVATDKDFNVVIFNPGAQQIFGYAPEEVIAQLTIADLLPSEIALQFGKPSGKGHGNFDTAWRELVIQDKAGHAIPVRFYGTLLYEKDDVIGAVCFFQDLREIKRLETELVHSERLAAIGQTVAGVAHGVKNILHGFKGGSYLVDLGINKNDATRLKKGWEMIQRNIGRTSNLVMDLLSYSRERDPQCEICQPNAIISDVCEVMQDLADQYQIRMVTDLDPRIGSVSIDPHTLHQCLTNLISNAIDACLFDENRGKQWRVEVKATLMPDEHICFTVSDNGTGMDEEVRAKLFASFFSTKGHHGTGLGLLVTRKLVKEHGGTIDVISKKDVGTTFTLRLPMCSDSLSLQTGRQNVRNG